MPSGKVHDKITLAAAGLSVPVWLACSPTPRDLSAGATLIVSLLFSGLALSPDLDLDSSVYRRWGSFRWIWWPYQKLVRHRSWISHSFLIAPLLRVAYFLFAMWGLFRVVTFFLDRFLVGMDRNAWSERGFAALADLPRTHPHHFQMLLLGLFLGAALHSGADLAVSALKRKRRRR